MLRCTGKCGWLLEQSPLGGRSCTIHPAGQISAGSQICSQFILPEQYSVHQSILLVNRELEYEHKIPEATPRHLSCSAQQPL